MPPWWPKLELKKTFQTLQFSITILCYLEAEINYRPLYFFVEWCSKIVHKKFQVDWTKNEGVTAIFVISILRYGRGGRRPPEQSEGPWGPKGARRRGPEHPELLVG